MSVFALALVAWLTTLAMQSVQAQTYSVLHNFTGGGDGAIPDGSLILDPGGNLYGAAAAGGNNNCSSFPYTGCGAVFKLHRQGSGWSLATLYAFGQNDGHVPAGPLLRDASGNLYGVTGSGGDGFFVGTFFQLRPSPMRPSVNSPWPETVLYAFGGGDDGAFPSGNLTADLAGNLYGVTEQGGAGSGGTVFKLTPSGGGWTETVLYNFTFGGAGGSNPTYGVVLDMAGNLYGTTSGAGSHGCGVVYELTPSGTETVIYTFTSGNDGCAPYARVILDQSGNLYGATSSGGAGGGGVAFELSPGNNGWTYKALYSFSGSPTRNDGPQQSLVMDGAGNLYGATFGEGPYGAGAVFELTPSNGSWNYTSLHDFTGGGDGGYPAGAVVLDSNNNVYGMTSFGGTSGNGVVYEIAP
jgi:uncharacterized repeat protein (TIGR03803 family)